MLDYYPIHLLLLDSFKLSKYIDHLSLILLPINTLSTNSTIIRSLSEISFLIYFSLVAICIHHITSIKSLLFFVVKYFHRSLASLGRRYYIERFLWGWLHKTQQWLHLNWSLYFHCRQLFNFRVLKKQTRTWRSSYKSK